jgi:anion-transporting  ArsA/GET3 family ATPase
VSDIASPERLLDKRIAVCVGAGGVGKTTLAAAIGLSAARRGRRAVVVTIDPARRLADALGVGTLDNQPRAIPRDVLAGLSVPEEGALFAMMLDMKRTFDELVARFAADDEARERILQNSIYQHVSDALAGSAEYSAMEKVFEISERQEFDLIVLDTPPSQHALDFLEAPERLLEFLDSRLVHVLVHPALAAGRFGVRVFQRGTRRILDPEAHRARLGNRLPGGHLGVPHGLRGDVRGVRGACAPGAGDASRPGHLVRARRRPRRGVRRAR